MASFTPAFRLASDLLDVHFLRSYYALHQGSAHTAHASNALSWGARRIRKKSYAKVFRASVRAETSRL
ncbi:hypothetical protein FKK81_26090, partial [Klebsiella pneumoniae]|nr:hypothetical protein [Klebsiella pneumoniae]